MYGSGKATKPKNIGVKHIQNDSVFIYFETDSFEKACKELDNKIEDAYWDLGVRVLQQIHTQKANEVNTKEELK